MIEPVVFQLFGNEIWSSAILFSVIVVGLFGLLGAFSKTATLAVYSAFLAFIHMATATGQALFTNIMYVTMALLVIAMVVRLWGFTFGSGEDVA